MSEEEDDKGGLVVGGISFGMGSQSTTATKGEGASEPAQAASAPIELGDVLMPLRVAVVADLIPRDEFNAGANPPDHPIGVQPMDLDGLFAKLRPKAALEVESVLGESKVVRVDFAPTSMKSFRPDGLASDIPLLRSLLDGRKVLERLRDATIDVDGAQTELTRLWNHSPFVTTVLGGVARPAAKAATAPAAPPPQAAAEAVADILDMVDLGTSADASEVSSSAAVAAAPSGSAASGSSAKGKFGGLIAAVAHSGSSAKPGANPTQAIATVEKAFGLQLGAITQHPEFRRLEEAWRGVDLLVGRTPKIGVILEVTSAREDQTAEALTRAIEHNANVSPPVSFAVVDCVIDGDAESLARMRAISEIAEQNTVPVLMNTASTLFGHGDLHQIDRLDNKKALFEAPERVPWRSEAHRPPMLWVSLALNRVFARPAYDRRSSRIREAQIEELPAGDAATVWMQPAWAVATLALRSFDKHEWPCGITGARNGGIIEDLTVYETELPGGEKIALPLEAFFSTETQRALGRIGVLALASQPNTDEAYLLSAATAYVTPPKKTYDAGNPEAEVRLPQASLVDQLFVARLAQFLTSLGGKVGSNESLDDIEKFLEAAVWELFRNAKPGSTEISISVEEGPRVSVTIRPRSFLGVGMAEITLGVPLG